MAARTVTFDGLRVFETPVLHASKVRSEQIDSVLDTNIVLID